jgi:hypothetical protein
LKTFARKIKLVAMNQSQDPPKFGKLFSEAVNQSVRDYYHLHRDLLVPGHWQVRLRKRAPLVPCRTYLTDCEPGTDNLLDRWPLPFLAGEILGEVCDPEDIFACPERRPIRPLVTSSCTLTIEQTYAYMVADARHAAEHRPWDPLSKPMRRVDLTKADPLF